MPWSSQGHLNWQCLAKVPLLNNGLVGKQNRIMAAEAEDTVLLSELFHQTTWRVLGWRDVPHLAEFLGDHGGCCAARSFLELGHF